MLGLHVSSATGVTAQAGQLLERLGSLVSTILYLTIQARPLLSRAVNFVTTTEPALLAEYALGGVAAYYLVGTRCHMSPDRTRPADSTASSSS